MRFIRSELLELSWCSIPCNLDCGLVSIRTGAKAMSATPLRDVARATLEEMKARLGDVLVTPISPIVVQS